MRANLDAAGLGHLVEIRQGDAQLTLGDLDEPIAFLFLDGSNDLYVPILQMLEPQLAPHAMIAADLSAGDPHHQRYREYVADPNHGYLSIEIPVDAGLVVSTKR
jgi:predicted O-methyltransferase YrrM